MPVEQLTHRATESDLESRLHGVLNRVFPWLEPGSIQHQTKFTFTFGRATLDVDGEKVSRHEARTDIVLHHNGAPLAVLELKRPDGTLMPADREQGLSYARMLHPSPPLVVVTNGQDTEFFVSHTGESWRPADPSEQEVARLFAAAGQVAAADMKRAMDVLLSPKSELWVEALRAASRDEIAEMTGELGDSLQPFAKEFLIPRAATDAILAALETRRVILVEGTPLCGKSNVLRELVAKTAESSKFAVLYLDAGAGTRKVLQYLANSLSGALGWQVSLDEVRQWLRNLSLSQGPDLVIAVDGLASNRDEIYGELEELTGGVGVKLKIVVAVDDTIAKRLVVSPNGRKASAIGRKAVRIPVGPLSDDEFDAAMGVLADHKVGVLFGGKEAEEYRAPWVLRAVLAQAAPSIDSSIPEAAMRLVPSLLGIELVQHARAVFADHQDLRRRFHQVACAVLDDTARPDRDIDQILFSLLIFQVRRGTLEAYLGSQEMEDLFEQGLIRELLNDSGEAIVVVRLPELLAAELALELSNKVIAQIQNQENPAAWLAKTARLLPLGDIIGAQAILDAATRLNGIPSNVLLWFLRNPSVQKPVVAGTEGKVFFPGVGPMDIEFKPDGVVHFVYQGERIQIDTGEEEFGTLADATNELILSHIAAYPLGVQSQDGTLCGRIDQHLLLEIGSYPFVLRRIGSDGVSSQLTHTIPGHGQIVCHRAGFIEPITMALYEFLSREGVEAGDWMEEAIARQSLPLLYRISLVLAVLESLTNAELAEWSSRVLRDRVEPVLSQFPAVACG